MFSPLEKRVLDYAVALSGSLDDLSLAIDWDGTRELREQASWARGAGS